eukprot:5599239-Amphidinium_carterae.1
MHRCRHQVGTIDCLGRLGVNAPLYASASSSAWFSLQPGQGRLREVLQHCDGSQAVVVDASSVGAFHSA